MPDEGNGPFYEENAVYYLINGKRVYRRTDRHSGSLSGSFVGSRLSADPGDEPRTSSGSWPGRSEESRGRQRSRTEIPTTWLGGGGSTGSDPGRATSSAEPYHDAMAGRGPPRESRFSSGYNDYKDRDTGAEASEDRYRAHMRTSKSPSRKQRQAAAESTYGGQPLETRSFHEKAGQYARHASETAAGYVLCHVQL